MGGADDGQTHAYPTHFLDNSSISAYSVFYDHLKAFPGTQSL